MNYLTVFKIYILCPKDLQIKKLDKVILYNFLLFFFINYSYIFNFFLTFVTTKKEYKVF